MVVYATFKHNGVIAGYSVVIYPISKVVGTPLSAVKVMKSLEEYFQDQSVDLIRAWFACMDTTNVNSRERGGLKHYLKHTIPHLICVGCGNHKLALCFKHLLKQFPSIFETCLLRLQTISKELTSRVWRNI